MRELSASVLFGGMWDGPVCCEGLPSCPTPRVPATLAGEPGNNSKATKRGQIRRGRCRRAAGAPVSHGGDPAATRRRAGAGGGAGGGLGLAGRNQEGQGSLVSRA